MSWVAPDPKVSVQPTWSGSAAGTFRDWQPGSGLPSSVNETVPVGSPEPGERSETVAVSVTGRPASGLATEGVSVRFVGSGVTVWLSAGDALAPKRTSPP